MRSTLFLSLLAAAGSSLAAAGKSTADSLKSTFTPPQVFKNANLVHIISLEKNFVKEQINVVIENIASDAQNDYYLPFSADQMSRVGGLEVRDRKDANAGKFEVEAVEFDAFR